MKVSDIESVKAEIIDGLKRIDPKYVAFFKRLWCNNNQELSIEEAVNQLDVDKLNIVLGQVRNTTKIK